MSEISLEQRRFIIEAYYSTKKSFSSTQRRFCTKYAIKKKQKTPSLQLIRSIVQKFEKSCCVDICHNKGRGRSFLIKEKNGRCRRSCHCLETGRQGKLLRDNCLQVFDKGFETLSLQNFYRPSVDRTT